MHINWTEKEIEILKKALNSDVPYDAVLNLKQRGLWIDRDPRSANRDGSYPDVKCVKSKILALAKRISDNKFLESCSELQDPTKGMSQDEIKNFKPKAALERFREVLRSEIPDTKTYNEILHNDFALALYASDVAKLLVSKSAEK